MSGLMDILRQAGFSGQALNTAYAIAMAESSGNAQAHNGNAGTGDNSYGLFQINMLGGMGPERRKRFNLSSNDALFDPLTNAKIAYQMSKGGTDWSPWSTFNRGDYKKFLGQSGANVSGGPAPGAPAQPDQPAAGPADIIGSGLGKDFAQQASDFTPKTGAFTPRQQPAGAVGNPGSAAAPAGSSIRDKVIAAAMSVLGTPYAWGGGSTKGATEGFGAGAGTVGFDCSGLMMFAFAKAGISMPRTGRPQLARGERVPISQLRPGDLVGFGDGYHIALYLGNGQILESPRKGLSVRIRKLGSNENAWGSRLTLPGD